MNLHLIQNLLGKLQIDGWLFYDFRRSNHLACRLLEIPENQLLTRRFFYWIPAAGTPIKLISSVENPLTHLSGNEVVFHSWQELSSLLRTLIEDKTIAMEYSPGGAIPEISRVDGGTIDLVRASGAQVISSGDLLQALICVWDEAKWQSHVRSVQVLESVVEEVWEWLGQNISTGAITEYDVQQKMKDSILAKGCVVEHLPICAVNNHSADPHYEPKSSGSSVIKSGDWILIDLWCKERKRGSVYADITRVAVAASEPSVRQQEIFSVVRRAQEAAFKYVKERYAQKQPILGFQVDRVCRTFIEDAGYGEYFVHRTGHNIDESGHGPGAHLDDLETHDVRQLLPGTCFSIEPGIYLPGHFGVRLEYDVFLEPEGEAVITGKSQDRIQILKNYT